jgi:hypothetical protein
MTGSGSPILADKESSMFPACIRLVPVLLLATLTVSAFAAGNFRYKWRDAEGNLHYTDSLPADAGVRGYDVINAQGVMVKRVEPARTPEQRKADRAEADLARAGYPANMKRNYFLIISGPLIGA